MNKEEILGEFFGDFVNIKGFGCINVKQISIISGRKWGSGSKGSVYNLMIAGLGFEYISNEKYNEDELTEKIVQIIKSIKERN